ncbi:helix-turn-helix transcriptional regulator [Salipiger sp.]|uniref:helix-turn-helix transcriptional regulator n=1 Tax=Salipiger sp. TaxID=2078585 RepID=UPI003A97379F
MDTQTNSTATPTATGPRAKMLPTRATMDATGFSRPYLYALMKDGLFPRPVKWGDKFSVWPEDEVYAVINARVAGRSNEELRQLVAELTDARSTRI